MRRVCAVSVCSLQKVLAISDSGKNGDAELAGLRNANLDTQLYLLVSPTSADRLSLPCMRRGGPLDEGNPNPTCSK